QIRVEIPSFLPLKKLNDAVPANQRMFDYDDGQWASMQAKMNDLHNTEVATYDFFEEFHGLAIPRKYYGKRAEPGGAGQLCLEYIANSRMMCFHEMYTVDQVRQIARALGKLQACSLKKEPKDPELHKDFFEMISNHWPLETFRSMVKGISTLDDSVSMKQLLDKIDDLLPVYHGSNLGSTIHKQMGFRPVIVNGDLHTGNVLIATNTGQVASLIDWQGTHLGVGVEDLHRIALTALTAEQRRSSIPMLVQEMYNSMVENLDGVEPPYLLATPLTSLLFSKVCTTVLTENDVGCRTHLKVWGSSVYIYSLQLVGSLEDVLTIDIRNKKHIGNL
ncbi:hypothetical protein PENTCL1PPCAC_9197, partial [Pristionchus entomophagus]